MKSISALEFKTALATSSNDPAVDFIDVRTPDEYRGAHIEGVRNAPLDTLVKHLQELADKKVIYVHCRSGARAERAIDDLRAFGIKAELVNLEGGIMAWAEAGLPIITN